MSIDRITRRQAIKVAGAAIIASSMPGCGAAVPAARVVISVAWRAIAQVLSCVLKFGDKALTLIAIVEGAQRTLDVALSTEQRNALNNGGKLIIRTEDGVEHEVAYTVN
jgi:hypothetical protein